MQLLKANTAVDVLIGPFVDDTDGKTAETGLTISQADVLLSKNGQALTQKNDATAASHDSSGYYNCELDTTDTNTEGTLVLVVSESGALPVRHEFMVMAQAAYDSLFAAKDSGYMDVNVKAVSEDTTAADNLESACDNYSVTRGLAGTALPAAAADAAGGLPISDAGGLDLDTQIGTDIDAILADTNELQGDWANGGRLDLIIDELTAQGDTNEGKIDTIYGIVDAILVDTGTTLEGHLTDIKGVGWSNENLTTIDANIDSVLTDTGELQTDWTNGGRLDLIIDAILADTNELQTDDVPGLIAALNNITAADVWDSSSATLSMSFETMMDRLYQFLMNKMNITDATGAVALRNTGDSGDIATQTITDNDTTTVRTALTWS